MGKCMCSRNHGGKKGKLKKMIPAHTKRTLSGSFGHFNLEFRKKR